MYLVVLRLSGLGRELWPKSIAVSESHENKAAIEGK